MNMARSPYVRRFFALDQQLILSSAAPLTSLILVSRGTLLHARLLSVALSAMILSSVQVQSGGLAILRWFLACLQASFPVFFTLFLPLRRRALVTTCLRKVIVGALVTWAIYTHLGYLYSCYDQA